MADKTIQDKLSSFVLPLFVGEGTGVKEKIPSMPGIFRFSIDTLLTELERLYELGITRVLLFGIPADKDANATDAYRENNLISRTVSSVKKNFPSIQVITDVCLCAYTSHGHCGILKTSDSEVVIDRDKTLRTLAEMASTHAVAGADYVAPSAMAKEQVRTIREALDQHGYDATRIMGYSAKFASEFYGPFRDIADSSPRVGDRSGYQLNYTDKDAAIIEIQEDVAEGADIVMVKPALSYLDIIARAKEEVNTPLAAYNVSGEYAMVKAGAKSGYWNERKMVNEIISSIKRAGADIVISYHTPDIAQWLENGGQDEQLPV